ncbi:MAG: hypothetical protein ACI3ZI_03785, partial [Candidatus Cryptobacteroides sp.]
INVPPEFISAKLSIFCNSASIIIRVIREMCPIIIYIYRYETNSNSDWTAVLSEFFCSREGIDLAKGYVVEQ